MKTFFFLIIFVSAVSLFAQGEGAVPFLTLQQSPLLNGAGQVGVSVPMSDPLGFYFNPAQLGYFSRENSLSFLTLPQKTEWLGNAFPDFNLTFLTYGMNAGYNFKKINNDLPLSIGIGYIHNKVSFGNFGGNNLESYDSFDCYSIGASYDYYLIFNLGFSVKPYTSILGDIPVGEENVITKASGTAFDFGTLIIAPLSKLFFYDLKIQPDYNSYIKPKVDLSLGYSISNIGKKIAYIDQAQADPISRTARFGYTFNFGFDLFTMEKEINLIDYSFTAEAQDILIKTSENGTEYQSAMGDIKFGRNLISLKGDQDVTVHRGHIFKMFETFILTSGRFDGHGYDNRKTMGFGISSEGIFKLLSLSFNSNIVKFISNHLVLEYYDTDTFAGSFMETNFKGVAVYLKNFGI